jgi:chemotaxis protein histidine kinase CheA
MSKKTQTTHDDSECEFDLSDEEFEIEINQSDSKIVSGMKSESKQQKQEQKQEQKQQQQQQQQKQQEQEQKQQEAKQTKKNKKKTIIQKINIEEESEQISFINPCSNCEINRELLNLVRNLSDELNDVKNELKELKKMIKIKTTDNINPPINKKNVIEWLNNYIVPTITFDEFIENIIINMGHFEFLLEYKLSDTIQKIIQTNIVKNNNIVYPLYSSIEKSGKVYVFTEDETWEVITIEYLSKFVKHIENKLSRHCIEWKNCHSGKNNFNSELQERCQNAILKLYNISYTQDAMMNRVRYDLCVQLKNVCK